MERTLDSKTNVKSKSTGKSSNKLVNIFYLEIKNFIGKYSNKFNHESPTILNLDFLKSHKNRSEKNFETVNDENVIESTKLLKYKLDKESGKCKSNDFYHL